METPPPTAFSRAPQLLAAALVTHFHVVNGSRYFVLKVFTRPFFAVKQINISSYSLKVVFVFFYWFLFGPIGLNVALQLK